MNSTLGGIISTSNMENKEWYEKEWYETLGSLLNVAMTLFLFVGVPILIIMSMVAFPIAWIIVLLLIVALK